MKTIEVDGKKYKVIDNLGYVSAIGMYVKEVMVNGEEKMVVKTKNGWRFWTTENRLSAHKY